MTMQFGKQLRRKGIALVAAIGCLAVALGLAANLVRSAAMSHLSVRADRWERQTQLLAEAGLLRAAIAIAKNADYEGEQWRVAASELNPAQSDAVQTDAAEVQIHAESMASAEDRVATTWRICVKASYPADSTRGCRRSMTLLYTPPKKSTE